jgi:uncharacterized protein (DUF2237 family)
MAECVLLFPFIMPSAKNVLGDPLEPCSFDPLTGWFRDGCCNTGAGDRGLHLVCVQVTAEFLDFSQIAGNDLSTPVPEYDFPGLKPGDRWCLCVTRWKQALEAGVPPPVILAATHVSALEFVSLSELKDYAVDRPAET